ncbi:hypothetical protein Cgig2_011264 [Carnegiea gigantea]|uniref:Protein kinase domain-containing protein n=1 Tax=Carnegiea gigantea TaxID=171969 RepID=A0A9Q1KGD2_9CARY|nr:hypothetical protein Cgig2_011264 [Carnegiea gigantea]
MAVLSFTSSFSLVFLIASFIAFAFVRANTDANDVQALQVLYGALNNPSLSGWKSSGSDPCGESWQGVKCDGSAVISLELSGLGLIGTMGYLLSNLGFERQQYSRCDPFSDATQSNYPWKGIGLNCLILYLLGPCACRNLASNNLSGSLPYSISGMISLNYLNVSGNSLSQSIGDVFANHSALATIDLSHNNLSGDLPNSMSSLSNLSTLHVQNNQLTGSLNLLVGLPLDSLYDGNSFDHGPAPAPSPYTPPPSGRFSKRNHSSSGGSAHLSEGSSQQSSHGHNKSLTIVTVVGIVLAASLLLLLGLLCLLFCKRKQKTEDSGGQMSVGSVSNGGGKVNMDMQELRVTSTAAVPDVKPIPSEKLTIDKIQGRSGSLKQMKSPITAASYTVGYLQTATNSFSQDNIIGEGSLGRVYKAEFSNGKVMAVKKIDNSALSLQEEDNFLEAVSNMSRLRHPNIVSLAGYCLEYGQRLLVYEYIGNGSLHDMLHFSDDGSKRLTWNARVNVALGTARALEYLHEVCLPSVVHKNFKSANILLDEEFNPHLSDCGLAALTPNTERQVSTQMVGSFGYSAPEFALSGVYTTKSDVYSFGVVMLELLTGRKPLDSSRPRSEQSLVRWATPQLHDIDALAKMVDPALNGMYPAKSLSRFADIIALCVQPEPEFRPPMSEVVQALVRLVQRAGSAKRRPSDDSGFGLKTPDHDVIDMPF